MPCHHPIPARRSEMDGAPWRLNPPLGEEDAELPCGKCIGCRTASSYAWTLRMIREAQCWTHNRFATLTYDDEHLPNELQPRTLQLFLKRLRKTATTDDRLLTDKSASIRYVACGEYGERYERPHYHLCLFNLSFSDEEAYDSTQTTSHALRHVWGQGNVTLSEFTPARAGYIAGYVTKTGRQTYTDEDGVVLQPPFRRMSLRPAIGKKWLEENNHDVARGYIVHEGKKAALPRYYRDWLRAHPLTGYIHDTGEPLPKPSDWAASKKNPLRRHAAEILQKQYHARRKRDGI